MSEHYCHATGCQVLVNPRMHMCRKHWYMVPKPLRDALWAAYRPGQERRKDPTPEYLDAAMACVDAVAKKEKERIAKECAALGGPLARVNEHLDPPITPTSSEER